MFTNITIKKTDSTTHNDIYNVFEVYSNGIHVWSVVNYFNNYSELFYYLNYNGYYFNLNDVKRIFNTTK